MKTTFKLGIMSSLMVATAACGVGGTSSANGDKCSTTLNVGLIPIEDQAALMIGIDEGYFKEQGLTIKTEFQESGSNIVASTVSGEYDIATSAASVQMQAAAKDIPIKIIAPSTSRAGRATGIVVPGDSGIKEPQDLKGKRVGTNGLKNITTLGVSATVKSAGVDPSSVEFIEIPLAEQFTAMGEGHIDAMALGEPFVTQALDKGARYLIDPYEALGENAPISTWFASSRFIKECPERVESFVDAISKSNKFAGENPDAVRKVLPTYTSLTDAVAEKIELKGRPDELSVSGLEKQLDGMIAFDYIKDKRAIADIVHQP